MTNIQDHGSQREALSRNAVALSDTGRSMIPSGSDSFSSFPQRNRRMAAVSGAELNARLLILLGICITSAALVLSAVNILHG